MKRWKLEEHFLTTEDDEYSIPLTDLLMPHSDSARRSYYGWPEQMMSKSWCDVDAFIIAWLDACASKGHALDAGMLALTMAVIRARKRQRDAWLEAERELKRDLPSDQFAVLSISDLGRIGRRADEILARKGESPRHERPC